jgi:murein L,D-transpeptidase YafK
LLRLLSVGLSLAVILLVVSLGLTVPRTDSLALSQDRDLKLEDDGAPDGSPIMIRIFKTESELELWMLKDDRFQLFATYPICFWSGNLGPKEREGDRQAPEGFYSVEAGKLRTTGRHPRSFNIGFPNALDRAFGRTGSYILVHGGCTSVGCFAMTDPQMEEIYQLTERALGHGQEHIPVHIFPFRMTDANLAAQSDSRWYDFWRNLKEGYDAFEISRSPPKITVCHTKYLVEVVDPGQPFPPSAVTDACDSGGPAVALPNEAGLLHRFLAKRRMASSRSVHTVRAHAVSRRRHAAIRGSQRARRL